MYVAGGIMREAYIYAHTAGREGYGGNGEECMRVCVVCVSAHACIHPNGMQQLKNVSTSNCGGHAWQSRQHWRGVCEREGGMEKRLVIKEWLHM